MRANAHACVRTRGTTCVQADDDEGTKHRAELEAKLERTKLRITDQALLIRDSDVSTCVTDTCTDMRVDMWTGMGMGIGVGVCVNIEMRSHRPGEC